MPRDWKSTWDPQARAEYRDFMHDVCNASLDTGRRRNAIVDALPGLLQSHKYWVKDLERRIRYLGALEVLREFVRAERSRPAMSGGGQKSGVISLKFKAPTGETWNQLTVFELAPFEQIAEKRRDFLKSVRAYNENVAFLDKLLALREMVPAAGNPLEACEQLGIAIDDYILPPAVQAA